MNNFQNNILSPITNLPNIEFISSPIITDNKFAKVAFCKAPEGTFVELVEEL